MKREARGAKVAREVCHYFNCRDLLHHKGLQTELLVSDLQSVSIRLEYADELVSRNQRILPFIRRQSRRLRRSCSGP
jgi:hypothetical protein